MKSPYAVEVSPDGTNVYATCIGSNTMVAWDQQRVLRQMVVRQMQLIVLVVRLIAMDQLVSFVYNNLMPASAQIKLLIWVILLVLLMLGGALASIATRKRLMRTAV